MTYRDLVRNHLTREVQTYLDEMEEHEDYPDQTAVEERVRDFVLYLIQVHKLSHEDLYNVNPVRRPV